MPENAELDLLRLWIYAEREILSERQNSPTYRAVKSFMSTIGRQNVGDYSISGALDKWISTCMNGRLLTPANMNNYVRTLESVYVRAHKAQALTYTDVFDTYLNTLAEHKKAGTPQASSPSNRGRGTSPSQFIRLIASQAPAEYNDLILFAAFYALPIPAALTATRADYPEPMQQVGEILRRNFLNPHQTYVFPLLGKARTSRALRDELSEYVSGLLEQAGCAASPSMVTVEAWIEAAISCQITDSEIHAVLRDIPARYSYLNGVRQKELSMAETRAIFYKVANKLIDYREHWHVVRLCGPSARARRAVPTSRKPSPLQGQELNANAIAKTLKAEGLISESLYPYDTFLRIISGKKRKFSRPFISEYLFVRFGKRHEKDIKKEIRGRGFIVMDTHAQPRKAQTVADTEMQAFKRAIGILEDALAKGSHTEIEFKEGDIVNVDINGFADTYVIEAIEGTNKKGGTISVRLYAHDENANGIGSLRAFTITTSADRLSLVIPTPTNH